jgi:hypothetical protein
MCIQMSLDRGRPSASAFPCSLAKARNWTSASLNRNQPPPNPVTNAGQSLVHIRVHITSVFCGASDPCGPGKIQVYEGCLKKCLSPLGLFHAGGRGSNPLGDAKQF